MTETSRGKVLITAGLVVAWAIVLEVFRRTSSYALMAGFAVVALATVVALEREKLRGWFRLRPVVVLSAIAIGLVMAVSTNPIYRTSAGWFPTLAAMVAAEYGAHQLDGAIALVFPVSCVIVAEELLWRGTIITSLEERGYKRAAPWISIASYVLVQAPLRSPIVLLLALVCGTVWTLQRMFTKTVIAPLITHWIWSIAILVLWPLELVPPLPK